MSGMTRAEKNLLVGISCALILLSVALAVREVGAERAAQAARQQHTEELKREQEVFEQGEAATISSDGAEHYLSIEGTFDVRVLSSDVFQTPDALEASLAKRGRSLESYGVEADLDSTSRFVIVSLALHNKSASDPNAMREGYLRAQVFLFDFVAQEEAPYSHVDLLLGVCPGVSERSENRAFHWDSFELPIGEKSTLELLYEIPASFGEVDWKSLTLSLGNTPNGRSETARWMFKLDPSVSTE